MTKDTATPARVRRTQAEIVADLEAKAAAAKAKLVATQRKNYDALYAKYLKALDQVVSGVNTAKNLLTELDAELQKLPEDAEVPEVHSVDFVDNDDVQHSLLGAKTSVFVTDADGNEVTA